MTGIFDSVATTGTLIFRDRADPLTNWITFAVTALADVPSYGKDFTVTTISAAGSNFTVGSSQSYGIEYVADGGAGDVVGPAGASDEAIARFDGTTGKLIQSLSTATLSNNTEMKLSGIRAHLELEDRSVSPTPAAGHGTYWIQDTVPVTPMFTDEAGDDHFLTPIQIIRQGGSTNGSNITDWLGPLVTDYYSAVKGTSYGAHSADPTLTATSACRMPSAAGLDGYIESVNMTYLVSNATLAGTFHLYKFVMTDGSTVVTATDLGTVATIVAGGSTTQARIETTAPGVTATVGAGDVLVVLYKGTGSVSANYFYTAAVRIRGL